DVVEAVAAVVETVRGQGEEAALAVADQLRVGRLRERFAVGGQRPVEAVLPAKHHAVFIGEHIVDLLRERLTRAVQQRVAVGAVCAAAGAEQRARLVQREDEIVSAGRDQLRAVLVKQRGRIEEIGCDRGGERRGKQQKRRKQGRGKSPEHGRHLFVPFPVRRRRKGK